MVGLLVPFDCNLSILKQLVTNALQACIPESDITVQYQVDQGLPPMKLDNYSAVKFYVELKKRDSTLTRFRICITMKGDSVSENHVVASNNKDFVDNTPSWERTNLGSTSKDGSNNYLDKEDLSSYVEYANKFAESILADRYEETEKMEIEIKSTIIMKLDIEEIEKDKLYKNKEVIKIALNMYAIRNNFQ